MSSALPGRVCRVFVFRDNEYEVMSSVEDGQLVVQVEEKLSADQWRNNFTPKHIEELTRKTGNFKQFPVFVNMLHSAVLSSSDSVSLDLLTYTDLEALRNQKLGLTPGVSPSRKSSNIEAKRYLILTYTVEFDRIHYPLALPYSGKPDPIVLQHTIRKLQNELDQYKSGHGVKKYNNLIGLQQDYDTLLQEKEQLEEAFEEFKCQVVHSQDRKGSKEIRVLKKVIKNLEEDLLRERSKHQRYAAKKNQELQELIQELKELRSTERILQARVKSLNNELAVLKRGRGLRPSPGTKYTSGKSTQFRKRSGSGERQAPRQSYRTPSPRFDPTAYVREKTRRQQEIDHRLGRKPRSRSSSLERGRVYSSATRPPLGQTTRTSRQIYGSRTRTSSVGSLSSQASSRRSSVGSDSGGSVGRTRKQLSSSKKPAIRQAWDKPLTRDSPEATTKRKATTAHNDSSYLERTEEISEIDARLRALQEFMKKSLEPNKHRKK